MSETYADIPANMCMNQPHRQIWVIFKPYSCELDDLEKIAVEMRQKFKYTGQQLYTALLSDLVNYDALESKPAIVMSTLYGKPFHIDEKKVNRMRGYAEACYGRYQTD